MHSCPHRGMRGQKSSPGPDATVMGMCHGAHGGLAGSDPRVWMHSPHQGRVPSSVYATGAAAGSVRAFLLLPNQGPAGAGMPGVLRGQGRMNPRAGMPQVRLGADRDAGRRGEGTSYVQVWDRTFQKPQEAPGEQDPGTGAPGDTSPGPAPAPAHSTRHHSRAQLRNTRFIPCSARPSTRPRSPQPGPSTWPPCTHGPPGASSGAASGCSPPTAGHPQGPGWATAPAAQGRGSFWSRELLQGAATGSSHQPGPGRSLQPLPQAQGECC